MYVKDSAGAVRGQTGQTKIALCLSPRQFVGILSAKMSARSPSALRRSSWVGVLLAIIFAARPAFAQGSPSSQGVLSFHYTPAPRAQVAIWIEDASGKYLATVALTEAVGYRGIGNRPGSSDMNSGYRWPYGRREGVLPIWAHHRASAPGAQLFPRVIFQNRIEGLASRTTSDQSADSYYCLQFDRTKSTLDQLDAVSCASPFSSDKGRYITEHDVSTGYFEPYEPMPGAGIHQPLPLKSYYPPRMDLTRCSNSGCFDSADVDKYADDARAVMPEIDAVTIATPAGNVPQTLLFSVPAGWPAGTYNAFIEVNVEGDYNAAWGAQRFPTPKTPMNDRDSFSIDYGYAYRGQPSIVWKVPFKLGSGSDVNEGVAEPAGRSSWNYWAMDYGALEPLSTSALDANAMSEGTPNSGVDRLGLDADGHRFSVQAGRFATMMSTGTTPTKPDHEPIGMSMGAAGSSAPSKPNTGSSQVEPGPDAGVAPARDPAGGTDAPVSQPAADGGDSGPAIPAPPSAVADLKLMPYSDPLRAYKWVRMRMRAADSSVPLHAYEVRVSSDPISDEQSFIRQGRQAKNASETKEGSTYLQLPTDVPAGEWIDATIGDLNAETHYYVGVRARDANNQAGPLAFAEITTPVREFATVTPCFIATVAYGSPLASEVGVLRRMRDRYLLSNAFGQRLVAAYYRVGGEIARFVEPHPVIRGALRVLLGPLVALVKQTQQLDEPEAPRISR